MARPSKEAAFRAIVSALALAEERGAVRIEDAAATAGITEEQLRRLLDPVLYYEFRTQGGEIVTKTRAFLLTEDGRLCVDESHWLRDLAARPPDPDTALRLLVTGTVLKSVAVGPTPNLDLALRKLEHVVAADVVIALDSPPHLATVDAAHHAGRTLQFRYVNHRGEVGDREIEPWFVYSKWGRWYVFGADLVDRAEKSFRVDRMSSAEIGDREFDAPDADVEVPDLFDLREYECTVTLRLTPDAVEALPTPRRLGDPRELPDGRVEVAVTVYGPQRLEHLLVSMPPEAEVVSPPDCEALRREHAARLLALYDD